MQRIEKYKKLILQHMPEQNKSLTKEEHELAERMYSLLNFKMQQYDLQIQKQKELLNAKDDEDEFLSLVVNIGKVAVVGAVAFFAPALLPEALPFVGAIGTLSNSIATGVACGLADGAVQGLAVESGAQKNFSFNELLETSVSFGVGTGLNTASLIPHTVGIGLASAGTQLVEKGIGTRKDFDAQSVGLQMAASVVARAIGETMPALEKTFGSKNSAVVASTAANTAVNAVLHSAVAGTEPNLKEMSAAVVGALIGHKVGESVVSRNMPEISKNTLEPEKAILDKPSLALSTKYGIAFHAQNALNPNLKLQVNDLIAQGKWDEAKSFALEKTKPTTKEQKTSFKLGTTKDVQERMQARSSSAKAAMEKCLSPAEEISKLANQPQKSTVDGTGKQVENNSSKGSPRKTSISQNIQGMSAGAIKGIANMVPNAVTDVKEIINHPSDAFDPVKREIKSVKGILDLANKFYNADSFGRGELVGEFLGPAFLTGGASSFFPKAAVVGEIGKGFGAKGLGPQVLHHSEIKFSQSSVNNIDTVTKSMMQQGWKGPPIDVVRMADGTLITLDNTRLLAASRTNTPVKAIVHDASKPLTAELAERFTTKQDGTPSTWGEAVKNRINKQNNLYCDIYPNGSRITGAR